MSDLPENAVTLVESGEEYPDLDDILRLIRWSRDVPTIALSVASPTGAQLIVEWIDPGDNLRRIVEDRPTPVHGEAFYLGPHGEVYDANGEAL